MRPSSFLYQALDRVRRSLAYLPDRIGAGFKRNQCHAGDDVHFYRSCTISNLQRRPESIQIGAGTHVRGELLVFAHGGLLRIGRQCYIGEGSRIWAASSVVVGDRVLISHSVNIHDNDSHSASAAQRARHFREIVSSGHPELVDDIATGSIMIEDDAWIGFNSAILKGVRIGTGAIVCACSLVLADVPPFAVVAGNPARVIGSSKP